MSNLKIVGHRANHVRRITFYLKNRVDLIEFDVKIQNGKLVVYHGSPLYSSTTLTEAIIRKALDQLLARDDLLSPLSINHALEVIERFESNSRVGLWLDLKSDVDVDFIIELLNDRLVGGDRELVVSSTNYMLISEVKKKLGDSVKTAISISFKPLDTEMLQYITRRTSCDILSIEASIFDSWFKREALKLGLETAVWVVNSPSLASKLAGLDPDYIITDRPDLVIPVLKGSKK